VLVVDDQEDVRAFLLTALAQEGYEVTLASCARDGLTCLQRVHYNLVLSDYSMPGGSGTWMLDEAARRGLLVGTPAAIVTAHRGIGVLTNYAVFEKPLELEEFLEAVRRLAPHR
jgi:two-component system response regulator GlrR